MYGCAVIHPLSGATLSEFNHFAVESVALETMFEESEEYQPHCRSVVGVVYSLDPEGVELLQGGLYQGRDEQIGLDDYSQNLIDRHMEAFLEHVRRNRLPRAYIAEPSRGLAG